MNEDTLWKAVAIGAVIAAIYFANRKCPECPVCESVSSTFIPDTSPYANGGTNGSTS